MTQAYLVVMYSRHYFSSGYWPVSNFPNNSSVFTLINLPCFLTILLQTSEADVPSDCNYRDVMNLKSALWVGEIRWRQEAQSAVMVLVVIPLEIIAQFS